MLRNRSTFEERISRSWILYLEEAVVVNWISQEGSLLRCAFNNPTSLCVLLQSDIRRMNVAYALCGGKLRASVKPDYCALAIACYMVNNLLHMGRWVLTDRSPRPAHVKLGEEARQAKGTAGGGPDVMEPVNWIKTDRIGKLNW